MDPLEYARALIEAGQPVLVAPANIGWSENSPREFLFPLAWQHAKADLSELEKFKEGDALIAPCGHLFDVVDIDTKLGPDVTRDSLPQTVHVLGEHSTPSGGTHFFVRPTGFAKGPLTIAGRHVGDYIGAAANGGGRGFVYLPGTARPKYGGAGYQVVDPIDVDLLLDGGPDDLLVSILLANGRSRDGNVSVPPAADHVVAEWTAQMSNSVTSCAYGRAVLARIIGEAPDREGSRHNWYIRSMMRVVELAKAGCMGMDAVEAVQTVLARIMPEGGEGSVLAYAVANTTAKTGCQEHLKPTLPDPADPLAEDNGPQVKWPAFWAHDSSDEPDIIERVLPPAAAISIYSEPGKGKSVTMLDWAVKMATGVDVAGRSEPRRPFRVLYYDMENPIRVLKNRMEDMGYGPETDLSNLLLWQFSTAGPLNTKEGANEFLKWALRWQVDVVILDTMSKVVMGDENSPEPFNQFNLMVSVKLKEAGVAQVRLDHSGKDILRGARGSNAKQADLEAEWRLTVDKEAAPVVRGSWKPPIRVFKFTADKPPREPHLADTFYVNQFVDPLRHELVWSPEELVDEQKVQQTVEVLDAAGVPVDAGRPAAREALRLAGVQVRNSLLADAVKFRRRRAERLSPKSGTAGRGQ